MATKTLISRSKRLAALLSVCFALCLSACGGASTSSPGPAAGGKLLVVASTTQIRSIAEEVGGGRVQVRSILTPGADAHEFEPRPSDVEAIALSSLVLKNGIGLDDWIDKLIQNAGGERPLVTVTQGIPLRLGEEGEAGGPDPHVWFSAANAMTMTTNIRDALTQVDPSGADEYRANADRYLAELGALDTYIEREIKSLPEANRKIVTNHDVFGYYIERYGLTYVGSIIPSMNSAAQPSPQDIATLIGKLKQESVKAIFLESSINPALARQIGRDAGVKVVDTLYGDTLGEAGTPGATYVGMMRYNTDTIVAALK